MTEKLCWALQNGDVDQVKAILDEDKSLISKQHNGRPPLCIAADYGQTSVVEILIQRGADVNEPDKHGITPLLSAIYEGHTDSVKLLLSKGANKLGKAPSGESYVDCAEKPEIKDILK